MIKKIITSLLILAVFAMNAKAQYAREREEFEAKQLIAPGALLVTGTALHCFAHSSLDVDINEYFVDLRARNGATKIDDYVQYVPFVAYWGLGLLGAEAEHDFVDHLVEGCVSIVALTAITRTMKAVINSPRPNGADAKSFPSGHTGTVFMGAELVRKEYGWGWGTAAYALAAGTAVLRMYNQHHWFSDVVMGAGVGILSANIGGWLREPVCELLNVDAWLRPVFDPVSGTMCAQLALNF